MSFINTLKKGRKALADQHKEEEVKKKGTLRGGSSGIFTADGKVYGACPRKSYLRQIGWQAEVEPYADIMFSAGYTNEDIVAKELEAAGVPFKREEEVPVAWETEGGTKVTGRPDIVLLDAEGQPNCGIELKLISSIWTAKSVLGLGEPKSDHLIQAAHYSWQMGIPWKLVYANRAYFHISYNTWLTRDFQGSPYCEHKDDRPFRIIPAYCVFDLQWKDDQLFYSKEGGTEEVSTVITKDSIESYYEAVAGIGSGDVLGPRPQGKHVNGGKSYKACDYCELKEVCDTYEGKGREEWTDQAKLEILKVNKERTK